MASSGDALILMYLMAAVPLFDQGLTSLRHVDPDDRFDARSCAVCHPAHYEQWRTSRHAHAATNAIYLASTAHFERPWCGNCHAPMEQTSEGVSCATCHVRGGAILSASEPTAAGKQAHTMRYEPQLGESAFCAGCHEFAFPERRALRAGQIVYTDEPMQATYSEWKRSGTEHTCQSCHMREGAHLFPGAHDERFMREALTLTVSMSTNSTVLAELRALKVGHRFPTGDPFRRLQLLVCEDEPCTKIAGKTVLERVYHNDRKISDTTVSPQGSRTVRVELSGNAAPRFFRLDYFFGDAFLQSGLHHSDISFEIARGKVRGLP